MAETGRFWRFLEIRRRKAICTRTRSFCASGGAQRALFTGSCCHPTRQSLPISTADLYCRQLDTVAAKLTGKMDRVFFLHDNARPHVAKLTRQKIQDLGWTTLPHPPYSPDMAPTDYHLFRSLSHFLDGRQFKDDDDLKSGLQTFFDQKSPDFYKQGIYDLPIRWQYIVDHNGTYFVD